MRTFSGCARRASGFTLIEMLVVVAVIIILSGIVLRTTVLAIRSAGKGRATYQLQQLQNALNEYRSEYGAYPPVYGDPTRSMQYEFEDARTRMNPAFGLYLGNPAYNNPGDPDNFFSDSTLGYRYGLVSYLFDRSRGQPTNYHWYNEDTSRDSAAKARWAHFLQDIPVTTSEAPRTVNLESRIGYTNPVATLRDPWGIDYRYESRPPFLSYRLWSAGPDGQDGTADDLNADSSQR